MKTCDKCKFYTPSNWPENTQFYEKYQYDGECSKSFDTNDQNMTIDGLGSWDAESYKSGVYVGPKFGCIHWEKR
jgi:hypothetical protein